jgi:hypothetical protein
MKSTTGFQLDLSVEQVQGRVLQFGRRNVKAKLQFLGDCTVPSAAFK